MNYKLFSRTQQTTGRNNQQNVFGNPHNNASGEGYGYPSKQDGMLNKIHGSYQYEGPKHNFDGGRNQGNYNRNYQQQNDYNFYQEDYHQPNHQQQGYNQARQGYYGENQQNNPYANQDWRQRGYQLNNQKYGEVHYGAGQWQNTIQNYQTFNNWQQFDDYSKPNMNRIQPQRAMNWQPQNNRRQNGAKLERLENLEFKYRVKPDGQVYVNNRVQLTYTKNLIPDISAFSRSEPSIEIRKRKRSISDSDLEAEVSDNISEDIENSRRKRDLKGKFTYKTKSQADADFSGLANIKIEGLIQRKLGLKQQDKKSGGPTVADKVSNGNSLSNQKQPKTAEAITQVAKKIDVKEKPKEAPPAEVSKAKPAKNKVEKEKTESSKYNREELVSTLEEIIRTGKFDKTKVEVFDKYDEDLMKEVKYVRINIGDITDYNDHIISIKPDVTNKPPKEVQSKKELNDEPKKLTGGAVAAKTKLLNHGEGVNIQNKASFYQNPNTPMIIPESNHKSADRQGQEETGDGQLSVVEQAMHKTLTGKLQRNIKKMSDEEKISVFKQIKGNLHELSTNQYGRYVLVLFLKTNITAIVDALIAYFDKRIMELIKHNNGLLFSQNLIELKFKDVRLRRTLKRIDKNLAELMADQNAPQVVWAYANQLPSSDMEDFVEYCKKEYRVCIDNPSACKVFAKVFSKVSDVDRLEIELNMKTIIPQIFDGGYGKELVEVFFTKADPQNQLPLKKTIFENLPKYLTKDDYEYFFAKATEQKKTDLIDTLMTKIFKGNLLSDKQVLQILNNPTGYRTILSFFTLASLTAKDQMRVKLVKLRELHSSDFNNFGNKVSSLCDSYFSAPSK